MAQQDEFALTAHAEMLVIDLETGPPQASTTIEYTRHRDWILWHRLVPADWIKVPVQITSLDDPKLKKGSFETLKLKPGQTYEACIAPPDHPPDRNVPVQDWIVPYNIDYRGAPPNLSVVALRKRPEPRTFYSDGNARTGGTYRERDVVTNANVVGQLSLSTAHWVDTGDGLLALPGPKQVVARGPQQTFGFVIKDLLPGTTYYELLLLMDEFGNWEFRTATVQTLQRKVVAEVTELFIGDDSDDLSNGEASFSFAVQAMNPLLAKSNVLPYDNGNIETGAVAVPTPAGQCVLGPQSVNLDTRRLFFFASVEEDDSGSVPLDDWDTASGTRELLLPVGPGENVQDATDSLTLSGSDDLSVRVSYKYSVNYQ